jgi:uncharacterized protein (TIGR02118 family)
MMDGHAPWMLVSAVVDPAAQAEFDVWHREVHLPHVLRVPGIVSGRRLCAPPSAPNYMALYVFEDDAAIRTAFASSEAQQAREDWQRWSDSIRDLTVQLYAEIAAVRPLFRHN